MTHKTNRYGIYEVDHTKFGGKVDLEDFNTNFPNKKRISNQIKDVKESNQRKEQQKYKHMTLEELKEMRIVSNTNGRPSSTLTDEKWQKEFNLRKAFVKPYNKNITKLTGQYSKESGMWNEETQGTYQGKTNWQEYCSFINDVLKNIRSNQRDYCYFIYQIEELLKFHFSDLRTKYCDGYWEVWLER